MDTSNNSTGPAKKLIRTIPLTADFSRTPTPEPFSVKFLGPQPRKFTPTYPTTTPTTKKPTTLIFPQLTNYRNKYYPRNIQEVLKHVKSEPILHSRKYSRRDEKIKSDSGKLKYNEPGGGGDLFQRYKPGDPSEINLLATGSVRFAPPVWKKFPNFEDQRNTLPQNPPQRNIRQQNYLQQNIVPSKIQINDSQRKKIPPTTLLGENDPVDQMTKMINQFINKANYNETMKEPLTIVFKLYPMGRSYPIENIPEYSRPKTPQLLKQEPRGSSDKMTINLRVFPEFNIGERIGI
ncbi:hypothetical protein JTB14_002453 [Gonioctena quinquepunctata]|nr:hypothetical protein JTB14_002453 [Gonioctena quinquepunctata]